MRAHNTERAAPQRGRSHKAQSSIARVAAAQPQRTVGSDRRGHAERVGERAHVGEAEVQPLPRQRVHDVRRIAAHETVCPWDALAVGSGEAVPVRCTGLRLAKDGEEAFGYW